MGISEGRGLVDLGLGRAWLWTSVGFVRDLIVHFLHFSDHYSLTSSVTLDWTSNVRLSVVFGCNRFGSYPLGISPNTLEDLFHA